MITIGVLFVIGVVCLLVDYFDIDRTKERKCRKGGPCGWVSDHNGSTYLCWCYADEDLRKK